MSRRLSQSIASSVSSRANTPEIPTSTIGIVTSVILNPESEKIPDTQKEGFSTGKYTSLVGACIVRKQTDHTSSEERLTAYKPLDPLDINMPLVGESVELISVGNSKYYRRINTGRINIGNARENSNKISYPNTEPATNSADSYSKSLTTGIVNSSNKSTRDTKIGEYFKETPANGLVIYEGDRIIQSRFGQSIRFSGYNNPQNNFAPTIHIRNRQNDLSLNNLEARDVTEEDVNRDGSTILMSSGNYLIPFQPGVVDDGGSSNFKTKPEVFTKYPKELKGTDQVLINSGRLILSSKDSEMIFYSKGNYGFISDGVFSIDNGEAGANMNFNGDVTTTTNDNNFIILTGTGNIWLNTDDQGRSPARTGPPGADGQKSLRKEPLVRGQVLVDLLTELIETINAQVYSTPSGPTAVGPNNKGDFNKIKSKLKTMLSKLNYTE